MNEARPTLEELRVLWKARLRDAEQQLESARQDVGKLERDLRWEGAPSPDVHYAFQRALRAETRALERYARVLIIYNDLVVHEKIPPEQP